MNMKRALILITLLLLNSFSALAEEVTEVLCTDDIITTYHQPRDGVTMKNDNALWDDDNPIDIPLTYELANKLNINPDVNLDAPVGFVSVYKDGRILYDGKDITRNLTNDCNHGTSTSITEE